MKKNFLILALLTLALPVCAADRNLTGVWDFKSAKSSAKPDSFCIVDTEKQFKLFRQMESGKWEALAVTGKTNRTPTFIWSAGSDSVRTNTLIFQSISENGKSIVGISSINDKFDRFNATFTSSGYLCANHSHFAKNLTQMKTFTTKYGCTGWHSPSDKTPDTATFIETALTNTTAVPKPETKKDRSP